MSIEFEYKYMLSLNILKDLELIPFKETYQIRQGYLPSDNFSNTIRVRSLKKDKQEKWVLTFKQKIPNTFKVIELEQELDKSDAMILWKMCDRKLKKIRLELEHNGLLWELDLLKNGKKIYFAQLEIELEFGSKPPEIPDCFSKHILYKVPLTDERFSNKKLSDVDYAKKLYKNFKNGV